MENLPAAAYMQLSLFIRTQEKGVLFECCRNSGSEVFNYLIRFINLFNYRKLTDTILKQPRFLFLEQLSVTDNKHVTRLNHMKHLKEIAICCCWGYCGVGDAGISELLQLTTIIASYNSKITNLNAFKNLKVIYIHGVNCGVGDEGISELLNLETIFYRGNSKINFQNLKQRFPKLIYA